MDDNLGMGFMVLGRFMVLLFIDSINFSTSKYKFKIIIVALLIAIFASRFGCLGHYFTLGIVRLPSFVLGVWLAATNSEGNKKYIKYGWVLVLVAIIYKVFFTFHVFSLFELYTYVLFSGEVISLCYILIKVAPFFKINHLYAPIVFYR